MEPGSLETANTEPRAAATDGPPGWLGARNDHGAREGSLENPEVLRDVPGHIIPILEREFDDFDTESTRFLKGDLTEEDFIKFRLKQGVYGQRQAELDEVLLREIA